MALQLDVNTFTKDYVSNDDQEMSQAIEASLSAEMNIDPPDDRTLADRLRQGYRSVHHSPFRSNSLNILYMPAQ